MFESNIWRRPVRFRIDQDFLHGVEGLFAIDDFSENSVLQIESRMFRVSNHELRLNSNFIGKTNYLLVLYLYLLQS